MLSSTGKNCLIITYVMKQCVLFHLLYVFPKNTGTVLGDWGIWWRTEILSVCGEHGVHDVPL
jgi:hypothetical protein